MLTESQQEKRPIYGLVGQNLRHSYSPKVYSLFGLNDYNIFDVDYKGFCSLLIDENWKGINVTMPFKTSVISCLDEISEIAENTNAVNTVINNNGKLIGYNTDYYGLRELLIIKSINIKDKKVAILGSGSTSGTAKILLKDMAAKEIVIVSTHLSINYEEFRKNHRDVQIIINTTPVGMYPNNEKKILELANFESLEAVVDVIYNPNKTRLILEAEKRRIKTVNGMYMLVFQARKSIELFKNTKIKTNVALNVCKKLFQSERNIVLIGMPGSGKTTLGEILAKKLKREFVDTDLLVKRTINLKTDDIIERFGEEYFRGVEKKIIESVSKRTGTVIATGGGSILAETNVDNLRQNGTIILIKRDINLLDTNSRPLSKNIIKLYEERKNKYERYAEITINNSKDPESAVDEIIKSFYNSKL